MKLTIDFEKKQVIFTGDGSWIDFAECVEALESIDYGNEEGWSVSFRSAEIPQTSSLFDRMSKPYENPFKNPGDIYKDVQVPYTPTPTINPYAPPYVVTCGDPIPLTGNISTATYATTNLNYEPLNQ